MVQAQQKSPFNLETCARPNILSLKPYRCARDDYKDDGTNVLLDANENAFGPGLALNDEKHATSGQNGDTNLNGHAPLKGRDLEIDLLGLNRYPDPHQLELKQLFCEFRNTHHHTSKSITPDHMFVGVGSDEVIDALMRCFCRPGHDRILTCPPTYGMYSVSAIVNDVSTVSVPLDTSKTSFPIQPELINDALSQDPTIKLVYVCSPGNPTSSLIAKSDIQKVLEHPTWNGIVVIDEAYIDFSPPGSSLAEWVAEWPNLVVTQTLSKAFGMAGIRLGAAFCDPQIARLLNNLKAPYNISSPTSTLARAALAPENLSIMQKNLDRILKQRKRLRADMPLIPGVGRFRGGTEANFLLVEFLDRPIVLGSDSKEVAQPSNEVALEIYQRLAESKGVVVRFRGKELGCEGCLRITVGTEAEVDRFLVSLKEVLGSIYNSRSRKLPAEEEASEQRENDVVA